MAKVKKTSATQQPYSKTTLPNTLAILFCVIVALTPIISPYSQWIGNSIGVVTSHPWMAMASWLQVCITAFIAFVFYRQKHVTLGFSIINLVLFAVIGWLILSTLWAHNKFEATNDILYWLTALMGYLIAVNWLSKKQWLTLLTAIFISGVIAALVGIAQYLLNFSGVVQAAPPASFFGNKNMGAHYALLTFPLGIALFWTATTTSKQWFFAIGSSFIIIYIFYSTARAAWLSTLISAIFLLIALTLFKIKTKQLTFNASRIQSILASIVLIALFSHLNHQGFNPNALSHFGNEVSSITDQATTDFNNSNVRLIKWRNAWDLYKDNWLIGIGLNNWLIEYPIYHQRHGNDLGVRLDSQSDHTHNDYIQFAVESGIIGVLLFVMLVVLILRQLFRFFTQQPDAQQALLLIGVIAALIAIGIDALFSFPLQLPHTMFLFLLYLGIVSSIAKPIKTITLKTKPYIIAFGLASITSIILYQQWFSAEAWFRKANFDIQSKNHQAALVSAEKAYGYNPYKYDMLKYRAITLKNINHPDTEKAILAVLDSYPNNLNSLNRAVNFYTTQRRFNDALTYALKMKTLAPRSAYIYQNLAAVYQGLGRNDLVINNIKILLEIDPNNPNAAAYSRLLNASQ